MSVQLKGAKLDLVEVEISRGYNQYKKGQKLHVDPGRAEQWKRDGLIGVKNESRSDQRTTGSSKGTARRSPNDDPGGNGDA